MDMFPFRCFYEKLWLTKGLRFDFFFEVVQ